jgi:hypothetical protein
VTHVKRKPRDHWGNFAIAVHARAEPRQGSGARSRRTDADRPVKSPKCRRREEMGRAKAKRKSGAPGEIRTPDLLLRSVIQELHNPVTALLFCDLAIRLFGEIPLVLLPSCSLVIHCSKTQEVSRKGRTSLGLPRIPVLSSQSGLNHVTSPVIKRPSTQNSSVLRAPCAIGRTYDDIHLSHDL